MVLAVSCPFRVGYFVAAVLFSSKHGQVQLLNGVDEATPLAIRHHLPYAGTKAAAEGWCSGDLDKGATKTATSAARQTIELSLAPSALARVATVLHSA